MTLAHSVIKITWKNLCKNNHYLLYPIEISDLENLNNDEIVAYLERLLDVNEFRRELNQVSEFFVTREELGLGKSSPDCYLTSHVVSHEKKVQRCMSIPSTAQT